MSKPNDFGVYPADEHFRLQRDKPHWRGCNVADISIANLGAHWIWAAGYAMWTGNCLGGWTPLKDVESRRVVSREAAIDAARTYLADRMVPLVGEYPDARAIVAWLDEMRPAQADLFGLAA